MGLYLKSGYLDVEKIISYGTPFNFIVGGRGTGKTYGFLKYMIVNKKTFIYMRRTQTQVDIVAKEEFSPFKTLNTDLKTNIKPFPVSKYTQAYYNCDKDEKGRLIPKGLQIGYCCALSTFSSLRGFDASDVEYLIYDEFIPERTEKLMKHEASAFFNAIETIGRNRELKGQEPLKVFCLANSNDASNPIFMELGLVDLALKQIDKQNEIYIDRERGLSLFTLSRSPISKQKGNTALYRLTKGRNFFKMSLGNEFTENIPSTIKSMNLKEFIPIVSVGEICLYKHKSELKYYCCGHKQGTIPTFETSDTELKRFKLTFDFLWLAYLKNTIIFENYHYEVLLCRYFGFL